MIVLFFVLLAFGVMRLTEFAQELMPWTQRAWFVAFIAAIFASGSVWLYVPPGWNGKQDVIWVFGIWGASSIVHGIEGILRALKDWANSNWVRKVKNRREIAGW